MRTSEYNDRNEQYYWICDALGIRKPLITCAPRPALACSVAEDVC